MSAPDSDDFSGSSRLRDPVRRAIRTSDELDDFIARTALRTSMGVTSDQGGLVQTRNGKLPAIDVSPTTADAMAALILFKFFELAQRIAIERLKTHLRKKRLTQVK